MRIAYSDPKRPSGNRDVIVEAETLEGIISGLKVGAAKKKAAREIVTDIHDLGLYMLLEFNLTVIETIA